MIVPTQSRYFDKVKATGTPHRTLKHGRNIHVDSRSMAYLVEEFDRGCFGRKRPKPIKSVRWEPSIPALDQGELGSCTGNAETHALATPCKLRPKGILGFVATEETAVQIYSAATKLDDIGGAYPPNDTGSNGTSVNKYAKKMGWIKSYHHALTLHATLAALQDGPLVVGMAWQEAMYYPHSSGLVNLTGPVVGGHEVCLIGCDIQTRWLEFRNSWSPGWGKNGNFFMTFEDFTVVLHQQGDAIQPR